MKINKISVFLLGGILCLNAVSAGAQDRGNFYIGVNGGLFHSMIVEDVTRDLRRRAYDKSTYEDIYNGQFGGIYFGYKLVDNKHTFINLQAHLNNFNKEFIEETYYRTLTRKLDYSIGIDLQPGFYIKSGFLCFFNFSIERGKFRFSNNGVSTYDIAPPVLGYGFGAGIGYEVSSLVCFKVQYQYNHYITTEILSTQYDYRDYLVSNKISPKYDTFLVSLQFNFKSE